MELLIPLVLAMLVAPVFLLWRAEVDRRAKAAEIRRRLRRAYRPRHREQPQRTAHRPPPPPEKSVLDEYLRKCAERDSEYLKREQERNAEYLRRLKERRAKFQKEMNRILTAADAKRAKYQKERRRKQEESRRREEEARRRAEEASRTYYRNFHWQGQNQPNSQHSETMTRDQARQVLGLSGNFSEREMKKAFNSLMLKVHPDHGGTDYLARHLTTARETLLKSL